LFFLPLTIGICFSVSSHLQKKKKSGGGGGGGGSGGGGGQQQQEHAAEERDEKACADAEKGDDCADEKDKDEKEKDKCGGGGGGKDDKEKCGGGGGGGKDKDDKGKEKEKKAPPPLPVVTAVLKVDMHCHGCARRIRASVHRYAGTHRTRTPLSLSRASFARRLFCASDDRYRGRASRVQAWRAWRWRWTRAP
jgi:hypothetical protein